MDHLAERLEQTADTLRTVDRRLPVHAVPAAALGASGTGGGLPGRLGRELHRHWAAVLDARAHEAVSAAGRLDDIAQSVQATRRQYADTDDLVRRRLTRET
jgi:hypothetical protein